MRPSAHPAWLRIMAVTIVAACTFLGCTPAHPPTVSAASSAKAPEMRPSPDAGSGHLRTLGTIAAQRSFSIQVPRISGQGGALTLIKLAPNGSQVKTGDVIAEFDSTAQMKTERDAQAKFDDLSHQFDQK